MPPEIGRKAKTARERMTALTMVPSIAAKSSRLTTVCIARTGVYFPRNRLRCHPKLRAWWAIQNTNIPAPSHSWATFPVSCFAISNKSRTVMARSTAILPIIFGFKQILLSKRLTDRLLVSRFHKGAVGRPSPECCPARRHFSACPQSVLPSRCAARAASPGAARLSALPDPPR